MKISTKVVVCTIALLAVVLLYLNRQISEVTAQSDELETSLESATLVVPSEVAVELPLSQLDEPADVPAEEAAPQPLHLSAEQRTQSVALLDELVSERSRLEAEQSATAGNLSDARQTIGELEDKKLSLEKEVTVLLQKRKSFSLKVLAEMEVESPASESQSSVEPADLAEPDTNDEDNAPNPERPIEVADDAAAEIAGEPTHAELVAAYTQKRQELDQTREQLLLARGERNFLENALFHTKLQLDVNAQRVEVQTEFIHAIEQLELMHELPERIAAPVATSDPSKE